MLRGRALTADGRHGVTGSDGGTGAAREHGLARARLGYRRGQSALLALLAVLLVAATTTGVLYERAVEAAAVHRVLTTSGVTTRGIEVVLDNPQDAAGVGLTGRAATLFDAPVAGTEVPAEFTAAKYGTLSTTITYRDRQCTELVLTAGRCPEQADEVLGSTTAAQAVGFTVGSTLTMSIPDLKLNRPIVQRLQVVGLYRPFAADTPYWFGHSYSSPTGVTDTGVKDAAAPLAADAFFGTSNYVGGLASQLQQTVPGTPPSRTVDLSLRAGEVGVSDLATLRSTVASFQDADRDPRVTEVTELPAELDEIDAQRNDARTVVLVLAVQLAALAAIALGVVVAAAADQRRPELALLRLRGLGRGAAALTLTRELGAIVVAALVPGLAVAWLVTLAASAVWLRQGVGPELRWPVLAAAVGAVIVGLVIVLGVAWRTVRAPISSLLRQVPVGIRRSGVSPVEVAVAVVALAGLVTTATGVGGGSTGDTGAGDGGSPLALLTPTCLAVLVGLIAGRAVEALARRSGRRQLARGAVARGLALLSIARRSGARLTVVILAVATGLVVFAGQQTSVASAAWDERGAAVTGAPVVLQVATNSGSTLVQAVHDADPDGRYATPVVVVRQPGVGSVPVVAVEPSSFAAVASWGRDDLRPRAATLAALAPDGRVPAVTVTTDALTLDLSSVSWTAVPGADVDPTSVSATPSPSLAVTLQHADGRITTVSFGPLPEEPPAGGVRFTSLAACSDGCRLAGLEIVRPVLDSIPLRVDAQIASLTTSSGDVVAIGPGSAWGSLSPGTDVFGTGTRLSMTLTDGASPSGLTVAAVDGGGDAAAQHLDVPLAAPALAAGPPPTSTDTLGALTAATLAGGTGRVKIVGTVPFVPQVGSPALLVDLDLAARTSPALDITASPSVWLADDDPVREARLVTVLRDKGIAVQSRSTSADLGESYRQTAPGWSTQLALIVGVLAQLLAVLLVVLVVLTSRRLRQRDLAGLRLVGIDRRILQRSVAWELGLLVGVGMLGGTVAGLVGVKLALPSVPLFVNAPPVPIPVAHPLQWVWFVGAVVLGVVLLVPTVVIVTRRLVRGAAPARVTGDER